LFLQKINPKLKVNLLVSQRQMAAQRLTPRKKITRQNLENWNEILMGWSHQPSFTNYQLNRRNQAIEVK
jgi:hypothetical protein